MANVLLTGAAGAIGMDLAFSLNKAKVGVFGTEADQDNFSLVSKSCKYYNNVFQAPRAGTVAVSYTHLTLPTNREV